MTVTFTPAVTPSRMTVMSAVPEVQAVATPSLETSRMAGLELHHVTPSAAVMSTVSPLAKSPLTVMTVVSPGLDSRVCPALAVREVGVGGISANGMGDTAFITSCPMTMSGLCPVRLVTPSVQNRRARTSPPFVGTLGSSQPPSSPTFTTWLRICTLQSSNGSSPC